MHRAPLLTVTAAIASLVGGCDALFQLDHVDLPATSDAGRRDGGGNGDDDAATDAPQKVCDPTVDTELPVVADTWLALTPMGGAPELRGGYGDTFLLMFDTLGHRFSSLRLELTPMLTSNACGANGLCGACSPASGAHDIYFSRIDWVESEATRIVPKMGDTWGVENAQGDGDREPIDAYTWTAKFAFEYELPAAQQVTLPLSDGTRVAFQITTPSGSPWFYSREAQGNCPGEMPMPPRLFVRCIPEGD